MHNCARGQRKGILTNAKVYRNMNNKNYVYNMNFFNENSMDYFVVSVT
jgi:hypothetical protein